jgi:rod shape-determining protein MreB
VTTLNLAGIEVEDNAYEARACADAVLRGDERELGVCLADIGAGTTDVAVLAFGGIAVSSSVRTGGSHIDTAITEYMRKRYNLLIGDRTAEEVKRKIGSALLRDDAHTCVSGRTLDNGLPAQVEVTAGEIGHAITPVVRTIVSAVTDTLALTPPELAGDLLKTGITLTGGGALLDGLARFIEREVNIKVSVAADPMDCVVIGALRALCGDWSRSAKDAREQGEEDMSLYD